MVVCELELIPMEECPQCGKAFLTKRAINGHKPMCPENPDRVVPDGWPPTTHGRWGNDK